MKVYIRFWFSFFLFIFLNIFIFTVFNVVHESIHERIAIYHGCLEHETYINLFKRSFFICEKYINRSDDWVLQEEFLHSLNEILGYYLNFILNIVSIVIFWLFLKSKN